MTLIVIFKLMNYIFIIIFIKLLYALFFLLLTYIQKTPIITQRKQKGEKKLLVQIMELFLLLYTF